MSMNDYGNNNLLAAASSASANGIWLQVARCEVFSITVRVTVSAATLQATFKLQGSDFDTKSGSEATFTGFNLASVLPTGVTYSAGVLTFNNPAVATIEVILTSLNAPRFLRGVWTYTSGGGTVAADAAISSWSA